MRRPCIFARDILPYLEFIAKTLQQLVENGGKDYTEIVLQYWLERGELSNKDAFFDLINTKISHEVGDKIMSLGERLREEGRLEGQNEGRIEIARRMIKEGSDLVFVAKVTGLSIDKIKALVGVALDN